MALIFKDAEKAKDAIMASQKKEIAKLYEDWADEIGERAKFYSHKTTASSVVSERQMRELQKMLKTTGQEVSNEIYSKIKGNMYTIADAVVADNIKWLESFGFSPDGLNAAFSYVPDSIVRNLITGQIYDSGWSLSKRIWGDNEQTMKDAYQIMAKGLAENKPVFEIAKDLEKYVRPSAKLPWNPVLKMKNTKTGEYEYKRIYKKQVDYNAQRLARTLAQHSYQQSFLATTQKNPFITEYIWHSNGSRVCPICKDRDNTHYKKDELPMDHPNGMCIMEPVIAEDMVDQLADWFNNPDGTYPEIDVFAGNFGYDAKKLSDIKTPMDFVNKYGLSNKSPNAWYNSLTQAQKAEAKMLKEQSGLNWNDWYEKHIHSTGDPNLDFAKKWGTSTKSPSSWFNSLDSIQKAEAKLLKEQSGLTWNQWYEKYVFSDGTKSTKIISKVDDVFEAQLKKAGFSKSGMPNNFDDFYDWFNSSDVSFDVLGKLSKQLGYDDVDFDGLQKFFNDFKANEATKSLSKLDDTLAAAQKKLDAIPNKTYSGIWKEDVTLADYELKKGKIKAKKEYFEDMMKSSKLVGKQDLYDKMAKHLDDLKEFEKLGKKYAAAQKEVKAAKLAIQKSKGPVAKFDPSEYTDEAKAAAKKFTSSTAADKFHRPYLDEVWEQTTEYEHYSVWEYTQNSNPINKSLSGYHDDWSRYSFKGLGNTDLGHEDNWRHFNTTTFSNKFGVDGHKDYKNVVKNLTTAIDKSEMPESVYLVRGSDKGGLAGLLEGDLLSFEDAKRLLNSRDASAIKAALEGQTFTNHSFMSTGISQGTGFSGDVIYEIFAPKGTRAIYAEPASYFGDTVGMTEKLYKTGQSYSSIGHEAEVIIQRGTDFRITDVVVDNYGDIKIKMEVVNQPDYFKTGLEHTHNGGKTSYKK